MEFLQRIGLTKIGTTLLFWFQVFQFVSLSQAEDIQVSRCTYTEPELITLNCSMGHVINVHEAIYVRNQWEACMYTTGDCTERVQINDLCCGHNNCEFSIRKAYSLTCGYVTYFRVTYECVKESALTCGEPLTRTVTNNTTEKQQEHLSAPSVTSSSTAQTNNSSIGNMDVTKQLTKDETLDDMPIIIGSAATVAVLLVAIYVVLLLLRRFSWENEKFCILGMFVSLCKRQPPDGSEEPEDLQNETAIHTTTCNQTGKETKPQIDSNQNVHSMGISVVCPSEVYYQITEGTMNTPRLPTLTVEKQSSNTPCSVTHVCENVEAVTTDV